MVSYRRRTDASTKIFDGGGVKIWLKNRVDNDVTTRRSPLILIVGFKMEYLLKPQKSSLLASD